MSRSELASRATALLVVVLLVASPIVGAVGALGAAQDLGGSPDFATLPNTNVQEDLPVGAETALTAAQLQGSVMVSDHAETLQVVVTTPERAEGYVNGTAVDAGRGDVAIVFQDDYNHSGRQVAVPASAIRGALGHTPTTVHGVHESGDRWARSVEQRNGLLVFEVPKFSSNSVTFSGEVQITGSPATDGSRWTYELGADENVSDPNVTFTGHTATEWDNVSGTGLGNGATLAVEPSGNAEPRGPSVNGEPVVEFTGIKQTSAQTQTGSNKFDGNSDSLAIGGNQDPEGPSTNNKPTLKVTGQRASTTEFDAKDTTEILWWISADGTDSNSGEITFQNPPGSFDRIQYVQSGNGQWQDQVPLDIYVVEEGADGVYKEGTKVKTGWRPDRGAGTQTINISTYDASTASAITVEFVPTANDGSSYARADPPYDTAESATLASYGGTTDTAAYKGWLKSVPNNVEMSSDDGTSVLFGDFTSGQSKTKEFALSASASSLSFSMDGGKVDYQLDYTEVTKTENPAVDLDGDGVDEISHSGFLSGGSTATYEASSLGLTDDTATISTAGGSTVDVAVNLEEVTKTRDPSLTLNNKTVASYAGVLEDGATVDRNFSKSELKAGQNNLTVAVGDGTLSTDAPTPSVALEYGHRADVKIDTSYTANGWEESYNVSHTYAGDRENVEVTIPFSRTIYDVRHVDYRVNGGDWITASDSNWKLENGTTLVVSPTDTDGSPGFEAGDELAVRTAGYKVNPINGAITITDPTDPSDSTVDAEFHVDNATTDFHLEVGGTKNGDRVHYLASASWTADEEAVLDADGQQDLYLSNAEKAGSARVTTLPLGVGLPSGDVGIQVADAGTPKFKVTPGRTGSGDDVELIWHDTTSGETYELYSISRDRAVDKDTAESPVFFITSDSEDTYKIQLTSSDSGSSGGSGGSGGVEAGGGAWAENAPDGLLQQLVVGAAWAALVVVLVGATGRSDLTGRRRWILVSALSVGSGLFSLEVLRPGSVSGAVNVGLQEVVPLAGLATIGFVGYSLISWWRARNAEASTPETTVTLDVGGDD